MRRFGRPSFTVRDGKVRNLRFDHLTLTASATLDGGRVSASRLRVELTAVWLDERHVEGEVCRRGRFGRAESFRFAAHS